jgi:CheY-like chemotaxis protein
MRQQYEEAELTRRKIHEEAFLKLSQGHQRVLDELIKRTDEERELLLKRERAKARQLSLEAYGSLLASTEELGLQQNLQESLLETLRIPFAITEPEHNELKRKARLALYVSVLRGAWQKGKPSEEDVENLKSLQMLYGLSDEEHMVLTRGAKKDLGLPDETAIILVVEDDPFVLGFICSVLKKTYQTVLAAKNVDEATATTLHARPALILCDHHLGSDSMSGIAFYEKMQQNKYGDSLKDVPFVLMSAVRDEFFLRSAKNLGIRALLTKPFSQESLERTLKEALQ